MTLTTEREMRPTRIRRILRWTQRLLFITGALALGYVGITLLDARLYQASAKRSLEGEIHQVKEHHVARDAPLNPGVSEKWINDEFFRQGRAAEDCAQTASDALMETAPGNVEGWQAGRVEAQGFGRLCGLAEKIQRSFGTQSQRHVPFDSNVSCSPLCARGRCREHLRIDEALPAGGLLSRENFASCHGDAVKAQGRVTLFENAVAPERTSFLRQIEAAAMLRDDDAAGRQKIRQT